MTKPSKSTSQPYNSGKSTSPTLWRKVLGICVPLAAVLVCAGLLLAAYFCGWIGGVYSIHRYKRGLYNVQSISQEQLSVHFLQLDDSNGDCVYIKAGQTDVLIDGGAEVGGGASIQNYVSRFCTDGVLEYVVVTHGDSDHIAGFVGTALSKGLFERFRCRTLVQFARTNATSDTYLAYCAARDKAIAEGMQCFSAYDCCQEQHGAQRVFNLAEGITMEVLYQRFYSEYSSEENNYSVCVLIRQGANSYLFTGDLQQEGELSLLQCNPSLADVTLFKGAHHGSAYSSGSQLLNAIRPKYVCVCCIAGSVQYTEENAMTFPSQQFVDRIAEYTDNVYVTNCAKTMMNANTGNYTDVRHMSLNGDIVFACTDGKITMYFSHSNSKLKDTEWFRKNRELPPQWSKDDTV